MRGRRRTERYPLSVPLEGAFSFCRDLVIERYDGAEVVAISDEPASSGQELTLDLMWSRARKTVQVRVTESTPAIVDGHVSHRLRLAIVGD
jgi:hypothetical protein